MSLAMTPFLLSLLLFTPPLLALFAFFRHRPLSPAGVFLGIGSQVFFSLGLWWQLVREGAYVWALFPGLGIPGISVRLDGFALLFILLTTLVASLAALQALLYFRGQPALQRRLWWRFWMLVPGMNLVWVAGDLITLYFAMEVVALCVAGLIVLSDEAESLRSALRYVQAVLLGTLTFLLGVVLLYGHYGSVSFQVLLAEIAWTPMTGLAIGLITAGLAYRAALFPLHSWLPPAHGSSHAPLSALLSALVTKASFYSLARLWLDWGEQAGSVAAAQLLGVMGALAILWGGWMACRQTNLKMLVAYSSVNQVGYFFLLFPLLMGASAEAAALARDGAILQVLSHALAKAALFMAAGNLVAAIGSKRILGLSGVSRFLPLSLLSFGLAGVSIMGLPPSGGFLAKWYLLHSSLISGQWWWLPVLVLGGLLSAAYVFRVFRQSFIEEGAEVNRAGDLNRIPWLLEVGPMILALMAVGLGLFAATPLGIMMIGAEVPHGAE
jgi:multicomponent Na+:H+ antiporter subunit D